MGVGVLDAVAVAVGVGDFGALDVGAASGRTRAASGPAKFLAELLAEVGAVALGEDLGAAGVVEPVAEPLGVVDADELAVGVAPTVGWVTGTAGMTTPRKFSTAA